jgi:outer membrane receptor protein involved in Fe transport
VKEYAPDFEDSVYTDTRPALTPAFMGQLSTGYRLGEQLEVAVTGRYIGEQFITPRNEPELTVPASIVLDGRVRWTFWKQHELALYANNLLDALYYTYGEVGSYENRTVPAFYVQPPRNVNVMLTLRF